MTNLALARQDLHDCAAMFHCGCSEDDAASKQAATEVAGAAPGRLQQDTGFNDWTPLSEISLRATLESLRLGEQSA